jgi:hypothetical protein
MPISWGREAGMGLLTGAARSPESLFLAEVSADLTVTAAAGDPRCLRSPLLYGREGQSYL